MAKFHTPDSFTLKLGWAKEHLTSLDGHIRRYFGDWNNVIATNVDKHTRHFVITASTKDISSDVGLIAGDCVANIRACLDHLICQIVVKDKGVDAIRFQAFPIAPNATEFQKSVCGNDLKDVPFNAVAVIQSLQPYDMTTDRLNVKHPLWAVKELNNTDKHRALYLATREHRDVNITIVSRGVSHTISESGPFNPGAEIARIPLDVVDGQVDMNVKVKATSPVMFRESPVFGVVVKTLLREAIEHVETTVIPALEVFAH